MDSTDILRFIIKHCIDDPKLTVLSYSMKNTDYEKIQSPVESVEFCEQKELILKILESLWLLPEHIDLARVGYNNELAYEECMKYFINGEFINENNVIFYLTNTNDYVLHILKTFYEEFPIEGLDLNDPKNAERFNVYLKEHTLLNIQEFWKVFIRYQIVLFKYNKNGLGMDEWNNFGLSVYNELMSSTNKVPILNKINNVLTHILNPKEYILE